MDLEELSMMLESIDVDSISDQDFEKACEDAKGCKVDDDHKLILYGLYKQTLNGDITEAEPWSINVVAHAKWKAWKGFQGFPKKNARGLYVYLVNNWLGKEQGSSGSSFDKVGPVVSTIIDTSPGWSDSEAIFDAVVNNDHIRLSIILEEGCDVNCKSIEGLTPLHYAADRGYLDIVKLLIQYHADRNIIDSDGLTPLELAQACDHTEVIEYLSKLYM